MQPTGVPQRARGARLRRTMATTVLVALLIASCGPAPNPPPQSEASAAVSVAPSVSPSPSPPPSPTPTPTPTPAPTPTPTPTVSPTAAADIPACPGRVRSGHPVGAATSSSSRNWAGYVAASSSAGASCVEATWIEPTITCPSTGTRAVAIWVGIGGFSQTALVQLGTEASCRGGDSARISWQESLPQERSVIPTGIDINAGHRIHAQVLWLGATQYQVSMIDLTNGGSFSTVITNRSLRRTSAEWIVEAPAVDCPTPCRILSMPRFSTISFSRVQTTWGGVLQPLDGSSFTHQLVRMVTAGGSIRAQVTSTTRDGHAFKVVFRRA